MKNYTSLEQSKKLLELGLSPKSADMWWSNKCIMPDDENKPSLWYSVEPVNIHVIKVTDNDIPCWSIGALIKLLPSHVIDNKGTRYVRFSDFDHIEYLAGYSDGGFLYKAFSEWTFDQELIDVLYKCIVWLLENEYIKKGE